MAKEVIMPKFGFTQEESEIIEWLKKEGETVEKGDPIATVSTDKLSMEVEAPERGILAGIRYKEGDVVLVTKIIATILQPGEVLPKKNAEPETQKIEKDEPSKPEKGIEVSATPVALHMLKDAGIDATTVQGSGAGGKITKADVKAYLSQKSTDRHGGKVAATPAARRAADEIDIDLTSIAGSGPLGRIQEKDVKAAASHIVQAIPPTIPAEAPRIPLKGMRRIIAEKMTCSAHEIPHLTLQMDIDMSDAVALREQVARQVTGKDIKFTYTALITQAAARALTRHPKLNSSLDGDEIVLLPCVHIGVAVAVEEGLMVPVVRDADKKGVYQLSNEIATLAVKARTNKLIPQDLEGATFTISNLGMYGIDRFTAIINPPQTGILAVGNIVEKFMPDAKRNPILKPIMTITLSADHRVVDGAEAAEFLQDIKTGLENAGATTV
ncbi:MAG TPA: 2-oxo acid dehydrogenase subunit E2 [Anaerolineaceae bacterium]|nr:2-oxo acid dehydrogenase subunit E2 [Anaerolineaceae bacterium]